MIRVLLAALYALTMCVPAIAGSIGGGGASSGVRFMATDGTVSPLTFGAIPNDNGDDGGAFRAALVSACAGSKVLSIPGGTFDLSQEGGEYGSLNVFGCDGLTIVGVGNGTILRPVPRQMTNGEAYYLLNIGTGSDNITVRDLKIDGRRADFSCLSGTCEWNHSISISGTTYVDVQGVTIIESYGDGIRVYDDESTSIEDCNILGTERSGVALVGLNDLVLISTGMFSDTQGHYVAVDAATAAQNITISGNVFGSRMGTAVYLAGDTIDTVKVTNNIFNDGRVRVNAADNVVVSGNLFANTAYEGVYIENAASDVVVAGNRIIVGDVPCVYVDDAVDLQARGLTITANSCTHDESSAFYFRGVEGDVTVSGNTISSTSSNATRGIYFFADVADVAMTGLAVNNNAIYNESIGIEVEAQYAHVDNMAIVGNVIKSAKASSGGVKQVVWNHDAYTQDYSSKCRVDANVLDVAGTAIVNEPESGAVGPDAGEGCLLHGDAIP